MLQLLAQAADELTGGETDPDGLAWNLTFAVLLLPPIISIINQKHWKQEWKALTTVAVCIVYSVIVVLLSPHAVAADWRNTIAEVLIGTCVVYKIFWNTSTWGPKLEAATTIRKSGIDDPAASATLDDKTFAQRLSS